jgi:hypothetical protein
MSAQTESPLNGRTNHGISDLNLRLSVLVHRLSHDLALTYHIRRDSEIDPERDLGHHQGHHPLANENRATSAPQLLHASHSESVATLAHTLQTEPGPRAQDGRI